MTEFSLTPMVFVFVGALAAITSFFAIRRTVDPRIAGLLAAILWFVWGLASWRVVTITNAGEAIQHNWTALGWIGLAIAIIMILDWIMVIIDELDVEVRV